MQYRTTISFALMLLGTTLFAQPDPETIPSPTQNEFSGTLSFLSSDWMEGREAGTKGGFMAADYMASMMQLFGLKPYGDLDKTGGKGIRKISYFQDFEIIKYKIENASLAFIRKTGSSQVAAQLLHGIDFDVKSGPNGMEAEAPLVFAGYGISAAAKGYDDYKALDVNGKIVVILSGLPGHSDTTSPAWLKFSKTLPEDAGDIESKIQTARWHKAIAVIVLAADGSFEPFRSSQANMDIAGHAMNTTKSDVPEYDDPDHSLPGDTTGVLIPCFTLGSAASRQLLAGTGIDPDDFGKKAARLSGYSSMAIKDKAMRFSVTVKAESLLVRNVLGIIPGKDSTKSIVVGAHYDHLGIRNSIIYNGTDDNASGASGLLALAKTWSESAVKPPCNIIFGSWTAEEKGLLGSRYFVQHMGKHPENTLLYLNMDMICGSAPEDTARRIISIGTRTGDENLRQLAKRNNSILVQPFSLDLWDVTGHSGSDYASFTDRNIPVMTFFSGFNDYYHTPQDIAPKADLKKMGDMLKLVNFCLQDFLENLMGK